MTHDKALDKYREKVWEKADAIDPHDERDWHSMALGFFLALGFSIDDAYDLAKDAEMDCAGDDI